MNIRDVGREKYLLEYWRDGVLEGWRIGVMEWWSIGVMEMRNLFG
jgi:hypothetical protein